MVRTMYHVGFTGTRRGVTRAQSSSLRVLLTLIKADRQHVTLHHGDCVGADYEAHVLARVLDIEIVIHPPIDERQRAFAECGTILPPLGYLERNHAIVDSVSLLIATPGESEERLRSGTWATIRYALKKQITTVVVLPDGGLTS